MKNSAQADRMGVVGHGRRFLAAESLNPLCFSLKAQLASVCYMFSRIPKNKTLIRVESSLACTFSSRGPIGPADTGSISRNAVRRERRAEGLAALLGLRTLCSGEVWGESRGPRGPADTTDQGGGGGFAHYPRSAPFSTFRGGSRALGG